ncbi:hypothetical protein A0H81_09367 [Grifola frondosa]|uniref:Uncharacterized protein n=1 Tax=Grifola frondosa TaxID=5627 RepID=A0A1C7M3H8_GRIFR|nr:hypothetical protein A0H81_09367 [Grifola frondosa]
MYMIHPLYHLATQTPGYSRNLLQKDYWPSPACSSFTYDRFHVVFYGATIVMSDSDETSMQPECRPNSLSTVNNIW